MEPAVKGTLNVLKACTEAKVKRVVVVSSGSAVMRNPRWPKGKVKDETCWSDKEYCRTTEVANWKLLNKQFESTASAKGFYIDTGCLCQNWYCLSKTEAETEAFEYAKKSGLDVVRVCPTLVLGPILQSTINASSLVLIKLLKGNTTCTLPNVLMMDLVKQGYSKVYVKKFFRLYVVVTWKLRQMGCSMNAKFPVNIP